MRLTLLRLLFERKNEYKNQRSIKLYFSKKLFAFHKLYVIDNESANYQLRITALGCANFAACLFTNCHRILN